jgi:hypothetical protein
MRPGKLCSEKVRYSSRMTAVASLAAMARKYPTPGAVIPCQSYAGWHLTSKRKTVRRGKFDGGLLALLTLPGHEEGIRK